MSTDRWADQEAVAHIHNRILLSHKKNKSVSAEPRWMNWEPVIQSAVSQKEKSKYRIFTHTHTHIYIWNLEKWYWWMYLQGRKRDTDKENRPGTQQRKERVGPTERVTLKHILSYLKGKASKNLLCDAASSTWCSVGGSRGRGNMYTYGWFRFLYSRNQHNTVKQLSFN